MNLDTCAECDCIYQIDDMHNLAYGFVAICADCFDKFYSECEICNLDYRTRDSDSTEICANCLSHHFHCCGTWHEKQGAYHDGIEWYCISCANDIMSSVTNAMQLVAQERSRTYQYTLPVFSRYIAEVYPTIL